MASIKEIAYDLINHVRPSYSDDDDLDIRQLYYWIKNQRAVWINKQYSSNRPIGDKMMQEYSSLQIQVDTDDSNEMRTIDQIATPIFIKGEPKITYVGPTSRTGIGFIFTNIDASKFHGNGRFNELLPCSYYSNNYIYVKNYSEDYIRVRGVFEDPTDVTGFSIDTDDYPIDEHLLEYMKGEILKADLSIFIQAKDDKINDERNDLN